MYSTKLLHAAALSSLLGKELAAAVFKSSGPPPSVTYVDMNLPCTPLFLYVAFQMLFFFFFMLVSASSHLSTSSPSLFVFGASMVDAGENSVAMPLRSPPDFYPYGSDYFGKPAGRWSNGRTFMDLITEGMGYGHLPPYLRSIGSDFTHGVNFASGGSTAGTPTGGLDGTTGLFCLGVQVDQFQAFQADVLSKQHGLNAASRMRQHFSDSLYFFEMANNDYVNAVYYSDNFDLNTTVVATIAAMRSAFEKMYALGARTFLVMNVTPIGCCPGVLTYPRVSEELDENDCNAYWMHIVRTHNEHLAKLLFHDLRPQFPSAEWILFDAFSIFLDGYLNPSKYGIQYPSQACCGAGGKYNVNVEVPCGQDAKSINGTYVEWTKCKDPTQYLVWDTMHPVESFSQYVAQGVLNGSHLIPSFDMMRRILSFKEKSKFVFV